MALSPHLSQLIDALRCLPGVGPKSAQRMAFHLLERARDDANHLATCLTTAMTEIGHCQQCHNFTETELCAICSNTKRDHSQLCIVESPIDVLSIEQTVSFRGIYYVLMGHLSPLDGIGPEEIGMEQLKTRIAKSETIKEIIIATNPTVEGEATSHYIAELLKPFDIAISRIAHGVPFGGSLEFIDGSTLSRALAKREVITSRKATALLNSEVTA